MVFKRTHEYRLKTTAKQDSTRSKTGAESMIKSQPPVNFAKGSNYDQLYYSTVIDNSNLDGWNYHPDLFDAFPADSL
jgi:hypothetical protein